MDSEGRKTHCLVINVLCTRSVWMEERIGERINTLTHTAIYLLRVWKLGVYERNRGTKYC